MSDAITAIVGIVIMVTFLMFIAVTLSEVPVWIVFLVGIALMLWGFWKDAFEPLFRPRSNGS